MESSSPPTGLVVFSMYRPTPVSWHRWLEALLTAVGTAADAHQLATGWRLVIGVADERPDAESLREATAAVSEAGGTLAVSEVGEASVRASVDSIRGSGDELALLVDARVLVGPHTLRRLLSSIDRSADDVALRARLLPFDSDPGTSELCTLIRGSAISAGPAELCPEAVAVVDVDIDSDPDSDRELDPARESSQPVVGSSLLEAAIDGVSDAAARAVADVLTPTDAPLLSIIMRTQLRRPEAWRDVLLTMAAQRDSRFELLVVAHDVETTEIEAILAEQQPWLRQRTRVFAATGGTRSRPLNVGFAAARGTHVAVLDDDDIVTPEWVGSFVEVGIAHPHRVLRSAVAVQPMEEVTWSDGIGGHAATSALTVPYPPSFDFADHVRVNMTPFMAVAFPRRLLALLGGADEALEVCEDWDLLLRASAIVGVLDIPQVTAVYRRWIANDSYVLHADEVWQRDMRVVRAKLDARPVLLPRGSASELAALSKLRADPSELAALYASRSWRMTAPVRAVSRAVARLRGRGGLPTD